VTDALHESRPHRVGGVEHEGATQLPQLPTGHRVRDENLSVEEIQREVALHEAAAQPFDGLAAIDVAAE
jgi:hypothetical protein